MSWHASSTSSPPSTASRACRAGTRSSETWDGRVLSSQRGRCFRRLGPATRSLRHKGHKGHKGEGLKVALWAVDHAANTISHMRNVKVQQHAQWFCREPEI